jgi:hypothetical protein
MACGNPQNANKTEPSQPIFSNILNPLLNDYQILPQNIYLLQNEYALNRKIIII